MEKNFRDTLYNMFFMSVKTISLVFVNEFDGSCKCWNL